MKMREQIYEQEATSILRDITMYLVLAEEQLLRLYPGKRSKVQNLLSYLTKQGCIWHIDGLYCAAPECAGDVDKGLLAAIWVLADFIDRVEFHSVGDFPAKLIFFADGEVYEVIHAASGKEVLINHIMSTPAKEASSHLILVDKPEQIPELEIPNIHGYCTVSPEGEVILLERIRKEDGLEPSDSIPAYYIHSGRFEPADQYPLRYEYHRHPAIPR